MDRRPRRGRRRSLARTRAGRPGQARRSRHRADAQAPRTVRALDRRAGAGSFVATTRRVDPGHRGVRARLMDFDLTPEQDEFRKVVRRFAEEVVAPGAAERDEHETFPLDVLRQMAELGLFGLPFEEEYG